MRIRELQGSFGGDLFAHAFASAGPGSCLLDSGLAPGRFSFGALSPWVVLEARSGGACTLEWATGLVEERLEDPLQVLRELLRRHSLDRGLLPGVPFVGGAIGYLSYEYGSGCARVAPAKGPGDDFPLLRFGLYDAVAVRDCQTGVVRLVAHAFAGRDPEGLLDRLEAVLRSAAPIPAVDPAFTAGPPASNMGAAGFMDGVSQIREYIASGDVYQVNLAQRFSCELPAQAAAALYGRLRVLSPAPYGAWLDDGRRQILSVSPERFLELRGREVITRPIKGTRPRGASAEEDLRLRQELEASEKDHAELLMITDLERNDLGRVCEVGSVCVPVLRETEAHPTVWHLVSEVRGRLREDLDVIDLLRATFPGGSITGAPKIRAMQLIAELEPDVRGPYTGAIGYIGHDGDADFNIAIRTILCAGGRAWYHVGGGITWGSDPQAEHAETLAKGKALLAALQPS